jgi:hypothetical protein
MTTSQLGIIGGLAFLLCCLIGIGGWLILGGGLSSANSQPILPTANSTATLVVLPTLTPTPLPTPIPYEQLIPQGWKQHKTSLIEIWLPSEYKTAKLPKGAVLEAAHELILSQPASKTSLNAEWVLVMYEPLAAESLDAFLDMEIQSLDPSGRVVERRDVFLNTTPAVRVLVETRVNNLDANQLTFVVQDGGTVWYIAFIAEINEYYKQLELFEKSALTFRVLK